MDCYPFTKMRAGNDLGEVIIYFKCRTASLNISLLWRCTTGFILFVYANRVDTIPECGWKTRVFSFVIVAVIPEYSAIRGSKKHRTIKPFDCRFKSGQLSHQTVDAKSDN